MKLSSFLAVGLFAPLFLHAAPPTPTIRVVAVTNTHPPGLPANERYDAFGDPTIDERGNVAFGAYIKNGPNGGRIGTAVFSESGADPTLHLRARVGQAAPGTGGHYRDIDTKPNIRAGRIVFFGGNELGRAIWGMRADGRVVLVARDNGPGPRDLPASRFLLLFSQTPYCTPSGDIFFEAYAKGPGITGKNDHVLVRGRAGALPFACVAQENQPAPGIAGSRFSPFGPGIAVSETGEVAFYQSYSVGSGALQGIWRGKDRTHLHKVANIGQDVLTSGNRPYAYVNIGTPSINTLGQVTFATTLRSSDGGIPNDLGAFVREDFLRAKNVDALEGDSTPGIANGKLDPNGNSAVALNNRGRSLFESRMIGQNINGNNNIAVWEKSTADSTLVKTFRTGESPAFLNGDSFYNLAASAENSSGDQAFFTMVDSPTDVGVVARIGGEQVLIARVGNTFTFNSNDIRTVDKIYYPDGYSNTVWGSDDGRPDRFFSEHGDVMFKCRFTGGSEAIFVASFGTTPPPKPAVEISVVDGDAGTSLTDHGTLKITRDPAFKDYPLPISFTIKGTAKNGVDYETLPATTMIAEKQTEVLLDLVPKKNKNRDGNRTIFIELKPTINYTVGPNNDGKVILHPTP